MPPRNKVTYCSRGSFRSCFLRPLASLLILCGLGVPGPARAQSGDYRVLHTQAGPTDGIYPSASLVEGTDGNFYGTTPQGGPFNSGTIFRQTPAGVLTTLYRFSGSDGSAPQGSLVLGRDGNFYGTTALGGASNFGTVFKITPAGALTTLYNFSGESDGAGPYAALVQGSDGNFYGTTSGYGASSGEGTIFQVTPDGGLTTVHRFSSSTDGARPMAALVQGSDGNFYGTASQDGPMYEGTVFRCTPTGGFTVLYGFGRRPDGSEPVAPLVEGSDGRFYGTTQSGGTGANGGTVFAVTPDGTFTTLVSFTGENGEMPYAGLIIGKNGDLYGTTAAGGGIFELTPAGVLTTLYRFHGSDGQNSQAALVLGRDGNFYGTTRGGGSFGAGTVFALSAAGTFTSLHSFVYGSDGANPAGPLLLARDGFFYGVTARGGPANQGTVYRVGRDGTQSVLAAFPADIGSQPTGPLAEGPDGSFYGVTTDGNVLNSGTVFQVTPAGVLTILHTFNSDVDGAYPRGGLILARDGFFYGTAETAGPSGGGTVFKIDATGSLTVLHAFTYGGDGSGPEGPLLEATDGNFYGALGSDSNNLSNVFRLTPGGAVTTLHGFMYATDGGTPNGGLVQGSDGSLYGTATGNGPKGGGTLFKLTLGGDFTVLHALDPATDGSDPQGGLILGTDGNFYGTASAGGVNDTGTIYELASDGTFTVLHARSTPHKITRTSAPTRTTATGPARPRRSPRGLTAASTESTGAAGSPGWERCSR